MTEDKKPAARGTLVTGDFIVDQHIYEGERHRFADHARGVRVKVEVGGAGRLAELLKVLFEKLDPDKFAAVRDVVQARTGPDPKLDVDGTKQAMPHGDQAYAFWRRCPKDAERDLQTWHCVEAMGFGDANFQPDEVALIGAESSARERPPEKVPCESWEKNKEALPRPKIVVISDGGMGYRDSSECWESEALESAEQIVFKTANQPTASPLWQVLKKYASHLSIVIAAAELRLTDARVSAGLTWEETFKDLLRELAPGQLDKAPGRLHELTNCRNLVVTFDNEAAAAIQFQSPMSLADATVTFVYSAAEIEEDMRHVAPGKAFGFLTCFSASVAYSLAREDNDKLASALCAGLSAMRNLAKNGHGPATEIPLGFPTERIAKVIQNPSDNFVSVTLPYSEVATEDWSFLSLAEPTAIDKERAAFDLARLTAIYGPVAINNLPHLQIGQLITVDGEEITALRSLRQVLRRYHDNRDDNKPLSIGVFGPPGSGKSFAVKQIANNMPGKRSHWLEFNLSQFAGPKDLIGAFHQIRDQVLQGKLPIAFFDEFDSHQYMWLQYLLAPMQDGRFQEGEATHTIGRCVFVFAGGTSWTFDTFGPPEKPAVKGDALSDASSKFLMAKGPDFKSRLDAFLNVVGPNPRVVESKTEGVYGQDQPPYPVGGRWMEEVKDDIWWPIRRALFLRTKLDLEPDTKLDIGPGLVHALLRVPRYRHGSRSMEKILFSFRAAKNYNPSFVPHQSQLELHTTPDQFLKQLNSPTAPTLPNPASVALEPVVIEVIAAAIHQTWNEIMVRNGDKKPSDCKSLQDQRLEWINMPNVLDQQLGTLNSPAISAEMRKREQAWIEEIRRRIEPELVKLDSNAAAAARMPCILETIGLRLDSMSPDMKWSEDDEQEIRRRLEFHLDLLASEEHRGWMQWYLNRGWTYHPTRNDIEHRHNCLKPFSELPEKEKSKDRSAIRNYPQFARNAGYRIIPIS